MHEKRKVSKHRSTISVSHWTINHVITPFARWLHHIDSRPAAVNFLHTYCLSAWLGSTTTVASRLQLPALTARQRQAAEPISQHQQWMDRRHGYAARLPSRAAAVLLLHINRNQQRMHDAAANTDATANWKIKLACFMLLFRYFL